MADIYDMSSYNFQNPFDTDIGILNMGKMITHPDFTPFNPVAASMNGITMKAGNLGSDKVEVTSQKEKDSRFWSTLFKGGVALGAGVLLFKAGKSGGSKLWNGIKNISSNIISKFKK